MEEDPKICFVRAACNFPNLNTSNQTHLNFQGHLIVIEWSIDGVLRSSANIMNIKFTFLTELMNFRDPMNKQY